MLLVAALAITQGLQLLRGALASLSVYLGQVRDVDAALLALVIFTIFLAGFAAPLAWKLLGRRRAFLALAASLSVLRLAEQLSADPDARLWIQIAGVVIWLWLIPIAILRPTSASNADRPLWPIIAILLGLSIDTAIKGAFWTLDLGFANGLTPLLTTIAISGICLTSIAWTARNHQSPAKQAAPPRTAFVIGPGLALHVLIFQNLAAHSALIGWSIPAVFAWTITANLVAILVVTLSLRRRRPPPRYVSLLAAALLLISAASFSSPAVAAFGAMTGPASLAILWSSALARSGADQAGWMSAALGLLAIPLVLFGWYAHYEIDMPIPQWALPLAGAIVVTIPSCLHWRNATRNVASIRLHASTDRIARFAVPAFAALLLMLPLHQYITQNSPPPAPDSGQSLRVLTYNIHQGFDLSGLPSLKAIADLIESQDPDVVALQEVPRGWVVNGSVDALGWLSQRLGMHTAWGPAADPFWGNVVLSRYPIENIENQPMPNNAALRFDRANLVVTIKVGGESIQVVATHLHHIERQPHHRLPQVRALLEGIDWSRPTILLGDLNAQLHHEELKLLTGSGLLTSERPVPTYPAGRPRRQIDHILATDHFVIEELAAFQSTASDHLPLVAVLSRSDVWR